jgi:hypothetical protein
MEKRGLCMCGCGQPTLPAMGTDSRRGNIEGQPQRYLFGHQGRSSPIEYIVDDKSGCWLWQRCLNNKGYGTTSINGKRIYAHRKFWELKHGPIPDGQWVLHKCDNPACVNPAHLFLGNRRDNVDDMLQKGRSARGERSGKARLTEAEVREIWRRRMAGERAQEIAYEFGISRQNVSDIFSARSWKHLNHCQTCERAR